MKFQTPTVGGIRKIIRTAPPTTVGTTIAEIGAGTITLAQLAAAISQLQAQQNNNGGGNIGPSGIFIETGPGLGGGGGGGVVNLRLTAPIPVFTGDDGADGDIGPPGIAGKAGATGAGGPAGPAVFMLADDGDTGDMGPPGPPGPTGATGTAGTGSPGAQGPMGPAIYLDAEPGADGDIGPPGPAGAAGVAGAQGLQAGAMLAEDSSPDNDQWCVSPIPTAVAAFRVNGPLTVYTPPNTVSMMYAPNASGAATQGLGVQAVNTSDSPYVGWYTADGTLRGDLGAVGKAGNLIVGSLVGDFAFAGQGGGNLLLTANTVLGIGLKIANAGNVCTFTSWISVQGPTPSSASAGQTDLGITTTTTVITTAGGIALPALASTFWRVNVGGVAYGVPCFAL